MAFNMREPPLNVFIPRPASATELTQYYSNLQQPLRLDLLHQDTLTRIFYFALQQDDGFVTTIPTNMGHNKTKISLIVVCRRFHLIIVNNPAFWTLFRLTPSPVQSYQSLLSFTRRLLRRCVVPFLQVAFCEEFEGGELMLFGRGNINLLQKIVNPFAQNLQYLRCTIYTDAMVQNFFAGDPTIYPNLETLDVSIWNSRNPAREGWSTSCTQTQIGTFTMLNHLPRLSSLRMSIHNQLNPRSLPVSWSSLTTVDLNGYLLTFEQFYSVLASCTNVESAHFDIEILPPSHTNVFALGRLQRDTLRKFSLTIHNANRYRFLFDLILFAYHDPNTGIRTQREWYPILYFRNLESLTIHLDDEHGWYIPLITRFIRRSTNPSKLTTLRLQDADSYRSNPLRARHHRPKWFPLFFVDEGPLADLNNLLPALTVLQLPASAILTRPLLRQIAHGHLFSNVRNFVAGTWFPPEAIQTVQMRNSLSENRAIASFTDVTWVVPHIFKDKSPKFSYVGSTNMCMTYTRVRKVKRSTSD